MKKILLLFALLFFVFSVKAQEPLIVQGQFERSRADASNNFQRSMFCYFNGNFIMANGHGGIFSVFRVDSVISGSFPSFGGGPFDIPLALINEAVILTDRQNFTLGIRQFPHTNLFYIDSLSQVYPNEQYTEKLAEFHENHQRNIDILTKGTLQERRDFLHKVLSNSRLSHRRSYVDFRHISYIIPYMASSDSIINYEIFSWWGVNARGERTGGLDTFERKGLYSDFLYDFLGQTLPFALPPKTTDSIGWHKWFESLFSRNDCFQYVEYAQSERRKIIEGIQSISYFIADTENIHMGVGTSAVRVPWHRLTGQFFVLNINTDILDEKKLPQNCAASHSLNASWQSTHSVRGNERAFSLVGEIRRGVLVDGVYCEEERIPLVQLRYNISASGFATARSLIVHSNDNFFVFYPWSTGVYNHLNVGKVDRSGDWIVEPKILYKHNAGLSVSALRSNLGGLSFHQSDNNEITLSFFNVVDRERSAVIVYRINSDLEIIDSAMFATNLFRHNVETHLLKNDTTYLLLVTNNNRIFYKLLNDNLIPKTDFVTLAKSRVQRTRHASIVTSEGFMITWVDNDLSEGVLRSVLIDKSGKQSSIINVTNQRADQIFSVEVDNNTVDIYFHDGRSRSLIRKRINKSEFGYWQ